MLTKTKYLIQTKTIIPVARRTITALAVHGETYQQLRYELFKEETRERMRKRREIPGVLEAEAAAWRKRYKNKHVKEMHHWKFVIEYIKPLTYDQREKLLEYLAQHPDFFILYLKRIQKKFQEMPLHRVIHTGNTSGLRGFARVSEIRNRRSKQ